MIRLCLTGQWRRGQITRYFCLLKCSLCQIRRFWSHDLLSCHGWKTRCSPINHRLQFTTCVTSPAIKRSLLTTTVTDKLSWEVNKKVKHVSPSVVRIHYARLNDWFSHPMLIDCFWAHPTAYIFPVGLISGWYRVVWPWHKCLIAGLKVIFSAG